MDSTLLHFFVGNEILSCKKLVLSLIFSSSPYFQGLRFQSLWHLVDSPLTTLFIYWLKHLSWNSDISSSDIPRIFTEMKAYRNDVPLTPPSCTIPQSPMTSLKDIKLNLP